MVASLLIITLTRGRTYHVPGSGRGARRHVQHWSWSADTQTGSQRITEDHRGWGGQCMTVCLLTEMAVLGPQLVLADWALLVTAQAPPALSPPNTREIRRGGERGGASSNQFHWESFRETSRVSSVWLIAAGEERTVLCFSFSPGEERPGNQLMVPVSVRQSQLEYLDLDLDQGPSAGRNAPPPSTAALQSPHSPPTSWVS